MTPKEKAIEYLESLKDEGNWKDTLLINKKMTTKSISLAIDIAIDETKKKERKKIKKIIENLLADNRHSDVLNELCVFYKQLIQKQKLRKGDNNGGDERS